MHMVPLHYMATHTLPWAKRDLFVQACVEAFMNPILMQSTPKMKDTAATMHFPMENFDAA